MSQRVSRGGPEVTLAAVIVCAPQSFIQKLTRGGASHREGAKLQPKGPGMGFSGRGSEPSPLVGLGERCKIPKQGPGLKFGATRDLKSHSRNTKYNNFLKANML